jgi:hypothetical protein
MFVAVNMKRDFRFLKRWLRAILSQSLGWIAGRGFAFAKYRIDSPRPERYIERRLHRKLRRSFRLASK